MNEVEVAKICHEVNRAYCQAIGDDSQPAWEDAPEWQKQSAINGVILHVQNPDLTPEQSHQAWFDFKKADGWVYGTEKNVERKEHPCMVGYFDLPASQRIKDYLFKGVIKGCL